MMKADKQPDLLSLGASGTGLFLSRVQKRPFGLEQEY